MHEVKAKSILSARNGMNLYRGCSHGCIYCDSRSTCYAAWGLPGNVWKSLNIMGSESLY